MGPQHDNCDACRDFKKDGRCLVDLIEIFPIFPSNCVGTTAKISMCKTRKAQTSIEFIVLKIRVLTPSHQGAKTWETSTKSVEHPQNGHFEREESNPILWTNDSVDIWASLPNRGLGAFRLLPSGFTKFGWRLEGVRVGLARPLSRLGYVFPKAR